MKPVASSVILGITLFIGVVAVGCSSLPAWVGHWSSRSEAWQIEFEESGSYPVLVDGVLYVGSADGAVYALDPRTGETKWDFQTGQHLSPATSGPSVITVPRGTSYDDQMAAGISAIEKRRSEGMRRVDMTPTVQNGTVFIGSGDRSFYAIDAATSDEKWSYEAGSGMANSHFSSMGRHAAVVENGSVYFVTDDGLHALDALTGKRKWLYESFQELPKGEYWEKYGHEKSTLRGLGMADGVIFLTAAPAIHATPRKSYVYAIGPESGKAEWATSLDGYLITAPTLARELVFVAVQYPTTLYAIGATDGQVKWKLGAEQHYGTPELRVVGNTIYFSTGEVLLASELETGRSLWSFGPADIEGDPTADDKHIYIITRESIMAWPVVTLRALDLTTGRERWLRRLSGDAHDVMVHDGVVYAGVRPLCAIDAATGTELWSFNGTGREGARLISGNRMFLTSPTRTYIGISRVDQGYFYAVDLNAGEPSR